MRKTTTVVLAFLASVFGFGILGICCYTPPLLPGSSEHIQSMTSSKVTGVDWVRCCIQKHPELLWLADKNVRITEEGSATLQESSYSKQLFGKNFIEFDRTIMTLYCLQLILDGSDQAYRKFTEVQPNNTKLSRDSFNELHQQGLSLLESRFQGMTELEMTRAMKAALVLGDIGKSKKARDVFKPYGAKAPDHDDFYEEVMQILQKDPTLCPTFGSLNPKAQNLISRTAHLAHYGHMTHIEGGPGMFTKLKDSHASPIDLLFDCFVHTCDVAGALAHVNKDSSLVYTEPAHLAMQGVLNACNELLTTPGTTEEDVYGTYLATRADYLRLNIQDQEDRALTRIGAMLRLFTPEDGTILKQAILTLPSRIKGQVIKQLDIEDQKELRRTPTYMPAILVNLANNPQLGSSRDARLSQAIILGLPFIARVLKTHRERLTKREADPTVPLCFVDAARIAKTNPNALKGEYSIGPEGNVRISEVYPEA